MGVFNDPFFSKMDCEVELKEIDFWRRSFLFHDIYTFISQFVLIPEVFLFLYPEYKLILNKSIFSSRLLLYPRPSTPPLISL